MLNDNKPSGLNLEDEVAAGPGYPPNTFMWTINKKHDY